ncbi:MAG: hypothetical protein ACTSWY_00550 [Promethearchaeota archaeon]
MFFGKKNTFNCAAISNLEKDTKETKNTKKLSFHFCTNSRFNLNSKDWPNLEYIVIMRCKYFESSLNFELPSKIKQIYFANTEYMDIMDINGDIPEFYNWKFENSKYIKPPFNIAKARAALPTFSKITSS